MKFLKKYYAAGNFLVSGRKVGARIGRCSSHRVPGEPAFGRYSQLIGYGRMVGWNNRDVFRLV